MGIKYSSNEDYFKRWGPEMAYLLGYIYADGSLEDSPKIRGHYIRLTSIDKDRIQFAQTQLQAAHPIQKLTKTTPHEKQRFLLRIGSKKMFADLLSIGLSPKKSLTVRMPVIPKKYLSNFVRGYFDGDGCVYIETALNTKGKRILKALRVIFTSGSKKFLIDLEKLLRENVSLEERKITSARRCYQLRYSTKDSVSLFCYFYSSVSSDAYMRRKYDTFKKYFDLRKERIDSKVKHVLQWQNGLVAKKLTRRSAKPLYRGANPLQASR